MNPGESVDRFEVIELLGEGAIARVYRVLDRGRGSVHALKLLRLPRPDLADRLLQEGRVQARLGHPNVVAVTEVVEHQGRLGLVMECVDGTSLDREIERRGSFAIGDALALFDEILAGMEAAHGAGVLHRDLKPANILLARQGGRLVPKVADFGIAKVFDHWARAGRTRARTMMGTPGYTAPEQWADSASVDARADVFSLGVILYEMIAGVVPFGGETPTAVFKRTVTGEYAALSQVAPDTPPTVAAVVARALRPEPEDRYADAGAMRSALAGKALPEPTGDQETEERPRPTPVPPRPRLDVPTLIEFPPPPAVISAAPTRPLARPPSGSLALVEEEPEAPPPRPLPQPPAGEDATLDPGEDEADPPPRWSRAWLVTAAAALAAMSLVTAGGLWAAARLGERLAAPAADPGGHVDVLAGDDAPATCTGGPDEVIGVWDAGRWLVGGERLHVVRRDTPVYGDVPTGPDTPVRCVLRKGQRVRLQAEYVRPRDGRAWLVLHGRDLEAQATAAPEEAG